MSAPRLRSALRPPPYENWVRETPAPDSGRRPSCGYDETYVAAAARPRTTSPCKKLTGLERKAGPRTDRLSLNGGSATPTRSREGLTGDDALMNRPPTRSSPAGCLRSGSPPWRLLRRRLPRSRRPALAARRGRHRPGPRESLASPRRCRHRQGLAARCGCPAAPPARTPAMRRRTSEDGNQELSTSHRSAAIPTGSSKAAKTRARRSPPTSARSAWPRCSRRCPVARARGGRRTDHQSEGHTHRRQQAV